MSSILHADLDSFFASVEQRDDPRLRGKPVIVGAGVVLAASYEAKAFGVEGAMGGRRARQLCPHAIVVPPRMSAHAEASKDVLAVLQDMAPLVEAISIDEAFLDVRGLERITGTPTEIAERVRRVVLDRVGLPITVDLGLQFEQITSTRLQEGGIAVLVVEGAIVNMTPQDRPVPPIRITLLDSGGRQLQEGVPRPLRR